MINKHWPEPIKVHIENIYGVFSIENIVQFSELTDLNTRVNVLLSWDEDELTIQHRTAFRLENTYNACAGLNIQSDTKLEVLLDGVRDIVRVYQQKLGLELEDGKFSGHRLEMHLQDIEFGESILSQLEALLSEQIVQGE